MKKDLSITYQKFKYGDPISDGELDSLIKNHKIILEEIEKLNDRKFDLFRVHIHLDLEKLEGYKKARKNRI